MTRKLSPNTKLPIKDRLAVKLGLLFFITFLAVVIGGIIYDVFQSLREQQTEDATTSQPTVVSIDPKIENELAKVLSFEPVQNTGVIKDPFTDHSGISGITAAAVNNTTPAAQQQTNTSATRPGTTSNNLQKKSTPQGQQLTNTTTPPVNTIDYASAEATLERMRQNQARRNSDPENRESVSAVFAIADLLPVGVVSGGNDQQEVMFYSQAIKQTFSFPIGARFFDGVLTALRPEGVEFNYFDEAHTLQVKPWEQSIPSQSTGGISGISSPNLTIESAIVESKDND